MEKFGNAVELHLMYSMFAKIILRAGLEHLLFDTHELKGTKNLFLEKYSLLSIVFFIYSSSLVLPLWII